MNIIYVNYKQYENNYNAFHFTKCSQICDYVHALAKSKASRGKLNIKLQANDSTPFNRAFFVRNIRTPQEFADFVLFNLKIHSMVERNRQSLTGCLPVTAVFHPVMLYRPTVESLAVVSKISYWNLRNETIHFCGYSPYRSNQSHSKNPYHRRYRTSRTRPIRP